MVMHTCKPSTREAKARGEGQPELYSETLWQKDKKQVQNQIFLVSPGLRAQPDEFHRLRLRVRSLFF